MSDDRLRQVGGTYITIDTLQDMVFSESVFDI